MPKSKKSSKSNYGHRRRGGHKQYLHSFTAITAKNSLDVPRYFKRQMFDGVLYMDNTNTLRCLDYTGVTPAWFSATAPVQDKAVGSGTVNGYMFGFSVTPALSAVASSTDFTNLFRQFQLRKLLVNIEPMFGDSQLLPAPAAVGEPTYTLPSITSLEDQSDNAPPISYLAAIAYANARTSTLTNNKPHKRVFALRPTIQSVASGVGNTYAAPNDVGLMWMDSANSAGTTYNGAKFFVRGYNQDSAAGATPSFRITCTVYMAVRQPY